jgi:hypothetical protein
VIVSGKLRPAIVRICIEVARRTAQDRVVPALAERFCGGLSPPREVS